ncbi:MAG: hypothetical protein KC657_13075, partial [Myxococcales bacterium]|nr:hypothetical protein [Myxococcales bacterium]
NTGAGGPLMPTVFQHLASFGPARVTLNGKPFVNPYSGPTAPAWFGAFKVSEGVRSAIDGTVQNQSGGIFSPMSPADGATDPDDLEIQCIFHDDQLPPPGNMANFPPRHRFFYWLTFEDVTVQILQNG